MLLERAGDIGDIGGTWRDNTYPGLAVDIPSFTYSFAFEPKPDWSRVYAPGPEIKAYADHCAEKYRILPHVRLNATVTGAEFDEAAALWRLTLADRSSLTGRYLLSCQGALTTPSTPDFEGLADFEGVVMHTARWDGDQDLRDKKVAVIGNGAAVDPRDRLPRRAADGLPAHPDLGVPEERRPAAGTGQGAVPPGAGHPAVHAIPELERRRAARLGRGRPPSTAGQVGEGGRAGVPASPAPAGPRSRAAGEADAAVRVRLQAAVVLEHLLEDLYTAECGARHRRHRTRHQDRDRHRRRSRARWAQRRMPGTVFLAGNCADSNSYYFDEHGDAPWLRPSSVLAARWRSRHFNLDDYAFSGR